MYDNGIIILDETTSEEIVVEVGNTETSIMIDAPFAGAMGKASASHYGIVKIGEGIQVIDGVISTTNNVGTVKSVNNIEPDDAGNIDTVVLTEPVLPKNMQIFIDITGSASEGVMLNSVIEENFGEPEIYSSEDNTIVENNLGEPENYTSNESVVEETLFDSASEEGFESDGTTIVQDYFGI